MLPRRVNRGVFLGFVAALLALAIAPIVYLIAKAHQSSGTFTGADGPFPGDQLAYMSWIREASHHGLVGDLYQFTHSPRVFLHPMFVISAAFFRVGANIQISYLIWVPVAVAVLAIGIGLYTRRLIEGPTWAWVVAFGLGLFFVSPSVPLFHALNIGSASSRAALDNVGGESSVSTLTWGYLPSVIAIGLMPLYILAVERVLDARRRPAGRPVSRYVLLASLCGLFAAWTHPWQAETLLLITGGLVLWSRQWQWIRALAVPVVATLVPLGYYLLLPKLSDAWSIGEKADRVGHGPLSAFVLMLLPLAIPAALGLRRPRGQFDVAESTLVLWPLAAVAAFVFLPTFPSHSLEGIGIPLAVLATRAALRLDRRVAMPVAFAGLIVFTVPGLIHLGRGLHKQIVFHQQPFIFSPGERQALSYISSSSRPGGVMSGLYLGTAIPAFTGRGSYVGHPNWTPNFAARLKGTEALLTGLLSANDSQLAVKFVGPAFLVTTCAEPAPIETLLGPMVVGTHHFGCTSVYDIDANRKA